MLPRDYFASNRFLVEERGIIERGANTSAASAARAQIVRVARDVVGRDGLAAVSSFGTASAALLKLVSAVDPAIPVLCWSIPVGCFPKRSPIATRSSPGWASPTCGL